MFKKLKEYRENKKLYEEGKKALIMMLLNQYSDFLIVETEAKKAEKEAYEQLSKFGHDLDISELETALQSINKIAKSPRLTSEYFLKLHEDAKAEKESDLTVK